MTARTPGEREACVAAWSAADRAAAVLPADRRFVEQSASVRALVVDLAAGGASSDELFDACAVLGRMIAQHQGSPTLAAITIDHAAKALGGSDRAWESPARAAVVEGFAAVLSDAVRREANEAWEFPRCAVPIGDRTIALAAGYPPQDDDQDVAAWVDRVAKAAALEGTQTAFVSGSEPVRSRMIEALRLVGIRVKR